MSRHFHSLDIGDNMEFTHINFNVKIQAPFAARQIGMIAGGTGITPMIQALHAILGTDNSTTTVSLLYGSRTEDEILGYQLLNDWERKFKNRLTVMHVLSDESDEKSGWEGEKGFIGNELVTKVMPSPKGGDDVMIFVCGPPPMYEALCGPRGEKELSGVLKERGYAASQVYKF